MVGTSYKKSEQMQIHGMQGYGVARNFKKVFLKVEWMSSKGLRAAPPDADKSAQACI